MNESTDKDYKGALDFAFFLLDHCIDRCAKKFDFTRCEAAQAFLCQAVLQRVVIATGDNPKLTTGIVRDGLLKELERHVDQSLIFIEMEKLDDCQ